MTNILNSVFVNLIGIKFIKTFILKIIKTFILRYIKIFIPIKIINKTRNKMPIIIIIIKQN